MVGFIPSDEVPHLTKFVCHTDIYDHGKKVIKSKSYSPIAHATGSLKAPNLLATVEKSRYRRKRRLLSQGFSSDALKAFEPKMLKLLEVFCNNLVTKDDGHLNAWTEPKNMRDWCRYAIHSHDLDTES